MIITPTHLVVFYTAETRKPGTSVTEKAVLYDSLHSMKQSRRSPSRSSAVRTRTRTACKAGGSFSPLAPTSLCSSSRHASGPAARTIWSGSGSSKLQRKERKPRPASAGQFFAGPKATLEQTGGQCRANSRSPAGVTRPMQEQIAHEANNYQARQFRRDCAARAIRPNIRHQQASALWPCRENARPCPYDFGSC